MYMYLYMYMYMYMHMYYIGHLNEGFIVFVLYWSLHADKNEAHQSLIIAQRTLGRNPQDMTNGTYYPVIKTAGAHGGFLSHGGTPSYHPFPDGIFPEISHPFYWVPPWLWKPQPWMYIPHWDWDRDVNHPMAFCKGLQGFHSVSHIVSWIFPNEMAVQQGTLDSLRSTSTWSLKSHTSTNQVPHILHDSISISHGQNSFVHPKIPVLHASFPHVSCFFIPMSGMAVANLVAPLLHRDKASHFRPAEDGPRSQCSMNDWPNVIPFRPFRLEILAEYWKILDLLTLLHYVTLFMIWGFMGISGDWSTCSRKPQGWNRSSQDLAGKIWLHSGNGTAMENHLQVIEQNPVETGHVPQLCWTTRGVNMESPRTLSYECSEDCHRALSGDDTITWKH